MIGREEARQRVERWLAELPGDVALVVQDEHTREESFGWVFFYQSAKFVETGEVVDSVAGNAPLIVDCKTGEVHVTGTAQSVDFYVAEYEARCNRAAVVEANPVLSVLDAVAELEWARANDSDPLEAPPLIAWRFVVRDEALEAAIIEAAASHRGRVSWAARRDEAGDAWVIVPTKYRVFSRTLDDEAEYFRLFPDVCREAALDLPELAEHLRARLSSRGRRRRS